MKKGLLIFLTLIIFSCKSEIIKLSIEDVENIGYEIEKAMDEDNAEYVDKCFDARSLADRFLLKSNKKKVQQFNKGFFKGFSKQFKFGEILLKEKMNGSIYNFVRAYQDKNKNYHLLFRLYGNDGLNYHDHLIEIVRNKPKIIDTYVYISGEYLSQTFETMYRGLLRNNNFLENDMKNSRMFKDISKLKKMRDLNNRGEYEQSYETYKTISDISKQKKIFKLSALLCTQNLSESLYQKLIKEYEEKFPNDASLKLISIDGYFLKQQYDKVEESVNELDTILGGDSFLNLYRANVAYLKKDYKNSIFYFKELQNEYPEFIEGYDGVLSVYIEAERNKEAIETIEILVDRFMLPKEELIEVIIEEYPQFVKSLEYSKWLKENVQTTN